MKLEALQKSTVGDSLIRLKDVLQIVRVGSTTWWRWVADGYAPQPIHLGQRTTVWRASEIREFIEKVTAEGR